MTYIHKVPTTPEVPAIGALQGITTLCTTHGIPWHHIDHVLHGTTIAPNAVLENDGAVTGMVTTRGYLPASRCAKPMAPLAPCRIAGGFLHRRRSRR